MGLDQNCVQLHNLLSAVLDIPITLLGSKLNKQQNLLNVRETVRWLGTHA